MENARHEGKYGRSPDQRGKLVRRDLAMTEKRTPLDVWIFKGDALNSLGKSQEAKELWEDCLTRVRSQNSAIAQLCRTRIGLLDEDSSDDK